MKKLILVLLISIFANMNMKNQIFAQLPPQDSSYVLVFEDNFNDTVLNSSKWETNAPYGNIPYKLTCVQPPQVPDTIWFPEYYTPGNNLQFTGNSVKLQVKRENYLGQYTQNYIKTPGCDTCPSWGCLNDTCYTPIVITDTFKYTSARLFSKKKFKYGYFEIRLRLPDTPSPPQSYQGISTNFWLFNADNNVAWSELDIYEINCHGNYLTNNVHYQKKGSITKYEYPYQNFSTMVFNDQFTTFAVNWTPEKMEFYKDGVLIRTNTQKCDSLISMPIYIDMNIDNTQFSCERVDTVNTVLPYSAEIDYIKVYQLRADCNTDKSYCNNLTTHDYKTFKSITIDGGSCTDVLNNKPNESFTATDYILLDQGFEVGTNVNVKFDIIKCFIGQDFSNSRIANPPPYEIPPDSWYERLKHQ